MKINNNKNIFMSTNNLIFYTGLKTSVTFLCNLGINRPGFHLTDILELKFIWTSDLDLLRNCEIGGRVVGEGKPF